MKEILKTTLLEFDKSTFLIDLVKHDNEKLYISIHQTIQQKDSSLVKQEIKINPSLLDDVLEVLAAYEREIPQKQLFRKGALTKENKKAIESMYLKGIPLKDIALQFKCSRKLIKQFLTNRGIVIMPDNLVKPKSGRKFEWGKEIIDRSLLRKLKKLRKSIANRMQLPLYAVFHDRALEEMAIYKPKFIQELLLFRGIGGRRTNKFGKEFLYLIREFEKNK